VRSDHGAPPGQHPPPRGRRLGKGGLRRFVDTYGWRAYALPVLTVVTIVVAVDAIHHPAQGGPSSASALGDPDDPGFGPFTPGAGGTGVVGAPPAGAARSIDPATAALPAGGPYADKGKGTWHIVPGAAAAVGRGDEQAFTYTVEVEDGMDTAAFGGDDSFARMVDSTLANPKSWIKDPRFAFRRIDHGTPAFRVSLTSQRTTRKACGFDIPIDSSCFNGDLGRVVLDEPRWVRGAAAFEGDIGSYRQYLVNHEIGHAIGYRRHQPCRVDGGLAPVMMQQTFGTADDQIARLDPAGVVPADGKVCHYNPWPYPRG
jgi:hypothetical protein